jgi:hypothetical protein
MSVSARYPALQDRVVDLYVQRGGPERPCLIPDTTIRAIQEAGGKPLYQQFIGVDNNQCGDHAYAMTELYDWLQLQDRARR